MKASLLLVFAGLFTALVEAAPDRYRSPISMEFVQVPAGTFTMGTPDLDEAVAENPEGGIGLVRDEPPTHRVAFAAPFYLGATEVTQGQWLEVTGTKPGPEEYRSDSDCQHLPVVPVNWHDVERFILRLQNQDPQTHYRLPTETEWEYAARAGTQGQGTEQPTA